VSDADVVRQGYEAFARGDVEGWLAGFHRDAVLHEFADHPDQDAFHGREGLRAWYTGVDDMTAERRFDVEELIEGPGTVLAIVHFIGRELRGGIEFDTRVFHVFEMRDGKVARVAGYRNEAEARAIAGVS
jgi:uncharacterized protein